MTEGKSIARSKALERQQKIAQIRQRRRVRITVATVVVLTVVIGAIQLYRSDLFKVKKIDIFGNTLIPAEKIYKACDVKSDTNLISISIGDIRQRIIKDPQIKDVSVRRAFPSTLRIEVVERVPIMLISHEGNFYLIDEDLFVFSERQYAEDLTIPTVTDLPIKQIRTGDKLENDAAKNAVECLKLMDPSLRKTITLLSASSVEKLSLYNKDNIEILYGDAKQAEEKNKILQTILTSNQNQQVVFIDIRSYPRSNPVLRRIDAVP